MMADLPILVVGVGDQDQAYRRLPPKSLNRGTLMMSKLLFAAWVALAALAAPACAQELDPKRLADAQAAAMEVWKNQANTIFQLELAAQCKLIEANTSSTAIVRVQGAMLRTGFAYGVPVHISSKPINDLTTSERRNAKEIAEQGGCDRLTPAERGRLRSQARDLS
jgi:hypothetical protein